MPTFAAFAYVLAVVPLGTAKAAVEQFTTRMRNRAGTYTGSIIPGIASEDDVSAIARTRPYIMYGWGIDQNKQAADLLRSATLTPQDSVAGRYYGKYFNKTLMMAAGRGIPVEKVYAGGCVGDAGAPLVATVNGVTKLIGITSWFAKDCKVAAPTVFARVSYYAKDIAKAVIDVKAAAKSVKITKSVVKVDAPVMNGQLYINVGSATDACRNDQQQQPLPCPETSGSWPRAAVYRAVPRDSRTRH